ncbi:MAG: aminotransferase class III-fold pyridoxal phosphate-dependent enzyme [Terriglobales bacterium]
MMTVRKATAIIQARMSSARLPGKVLAEIAGQPMLWHVVQRTRAASAVGEVAVATSSDGSDDPIEAFCARHAISCYRGSLNDVLDRYYQAAKQFEAETIVRITADCPLIDSEVIDKAVAAHHEAGADYTSNVAPRTYPDGLDVEVFTYAALAEAWQSAAYPAEREHVTPYLRNSGKFRVANFTSDGPRLARAYRWTVDEPRDLEFVRAVYARLEGTAFGFRDVCRLLEREPGLAKMNDDIIPSEGYYKSLAEEPPAPVLSQSVKRSVELKARADAVISGWQPKRLAPLFVERGQGCYLWDADGNRYMDYEMTRGAVILGHEYPAVTEAVRKQLQQGTAFALPTRAEVEVAEMLAEIVPCTEMVRFARSRSHALAVAIRAARAITGREVVASCGSSFTGIAGATATFKYNRPESLEQVLSAQRGKVAAILMEPLVVVAPENEFLQTVRELASRDGALLIFDETTTGLRLRMGGAQEYYGVVPDLACFGNAMANGLPLAAVCGARELMKRFEGSCRAEAASLAAARVTLCELRTRDVVAHLWDVGRRLQDGYNVIAREYAMERYTVCRGLPPRTRVSFRDETGAESLLLKRLFQQECLKRGVLFSGEHNVCFSHATGDVDDTLRIYRTAMEIIAQAVV